MHLCRLTLLHASFASPRLCDKSYVNLANFRDSFRVSARGIGPPVPRAVPPVRTAARGKGTRESGLI